MGNSESSPIPVFMDRGSCKESFRAWFDNCDDMESKCMDAFWTLLKCMEAHSDYYRPVLSVLNDAGRAEGLEVLHREINAMVAADDKIPQKGRLLRFNVRGVCRKSRRAYNACLKEAEKKNENPITKCGHLHDMWLKCMDAHSDYYQPILAARKTTKEVQMKELEALDKKLMDMI